MKNFIVKHETCNQCRKDIPVWEYAPYNHDDYIRVWFGGNVVSLCTACWNRNFEHIHLTTNGWELESVAVQS